MQTCESTASRSTLLGRLKLTTAWMLTTTRLVTLRLQGRPLAFWIMCAFRRKARTYMMAYHSSVTPMTTILLRKTRSVAWSRRTQSLAGNSDSWLPCKLRRHKVRRILSGPTVHTNTML